ncbi:hypothetical protein [Aquimarina longa]|uniref:hypothetical protein n=1 Tax=Aquimarina longa TaxID=1080221 RepID=UPI000783D3B9|nr:hypothetical protein [Aquimarina longa]
MKRTEGKDIIIESKEKEFLSSEIFQHLENEINIILEEEIKTEKNRIKKLISNVFNDDYKVASNYYSHLIKI